MSNLLKIQMKWRLAPSRASTIFQSVDVVIRNIQSTCHDSNNIHLSIIMNFRVVHSFCASLYFYAIFIHTKSQTKSVNNKWQIIFKKKRIFFNTFPKMNELLAWYCPTSICLTFLLCTLCLFNWNKNRERESETNNIKSVSLIKQQTLKYTSNNGMKQS